MSDELVRQITTLDGVIAGMKRDFEAMRQRAETAERDLVHEKKCADGYHKKWLRDQERAEAAERACAEMLKSMEIPRDHELTGPIPECGCSSCNLHHKYKHSIKEQVRPLVEALESPF